MMNAIKKIKQKNPVVIFTGKIGYNTSYKRQRFTKK